MQTAARLGRWILLAGAYAFLGSCAGTSARGGAVRAPSAGPIVCGMPPGTRMDEIRGEPLLFSDGGDPARTPACTEVVNPERGFFAFRDLLAPDELDGLRPAGISLVYGQALLDRYRDRALDRAVLDKVRLGFARVRAAGLKVIPRFYYAADDKAADAKPKRALEHIKQLGPILHDNADVIAALHAGFVGAWGEWHPENRATLPERKAILEALLEVLPAERMVMVRRPFYKRVAFGGPLTAAQAFSGSALSRLGHLNDCFLATADDQGTYQEPGEDAYALEDSKYVVVGGETCLANPPRSECASALRELASHHWSFINRDFHEDVLASWKRGGCYETIACRLGYRFAVRGAVVPAEARAGAPFAAQVSLMNDGFARAYNPRPVFLALETPQGPTVIPTGIDARAWQPGQDVTTCLGGDLPATLAPGDYRVGIWLPDPAPTLERDPRYAIRLVGAVAFDAATGVNWLDARVRIAR